MLSVDVATKVTRRRMSSLRFSSEEVVLEQLVGRVLAEPIFSTRKQPPFDRVALDGIAISHKDYLACKNNGKDFQFSIVGLQKPGQKPLKKFTSSAGSSDLKQAIEVMTGAMLPSGTDTVIPYEHISISNGIARLKSGFDVKKSQNIHFCGSDYKKNKKLLSIGQRINSTSVAIISSVGKSSAKVFKMPKIAVISTGDELITPGKPCLDWQIWRSNAYAIKAELVAFGIPEKNIKLTHLRDDRKKMLSTFAAVLEQFDMVITSGGVSKGKFDFVKSVIADLGMTIHFDKVAQKPGKPLVFATKKIGENNRYFWGLPGNPVSALVCLRRYVITALQWVLHQKDLIEKIVIKSTITPKRGTLTLFKPVVIEQDKNGLCADFIQSTGSGDFFSLANSHGFVELPAGKSIYKAGAYCSFYPWKGIWV